MAKDMTKDTAMLIARRALRVSILRLELDMVNSPTYSPWREGQMRDMQQYRMALEVLSEEPEK